MRRRAFLVAATGVGALAGCMRVGRDDRDDPQPGDVEQLEVVESSWFEESFRSGVRGRVKNTGETEVDYVEVRVSFLDADGSELDSGTASTRDLDPTREWSFEVTFAGDDPDAVAAHELSLDTTPQ